MNEVLTLVGIGLVLFWWFELRRRIRKLELRADYADGNVRNLWKSLSSHESNTGIGGHKNG